MRRQRRSSAVRMVVAALLLGLPVGPGRAQAPPPAGDVLTGSVTWTVCASGCRFANPLDAFHAARGIAGFGPFASVTIQVADGTYAIADQFYTAEPGMAAVHVVGNTAHPGNVVFDFTRIAGTNLSGFVAEAGGRIGRTGAPGIDGVTLHGTGARLDRSTWADQSYGSGIIALGSGSNVVVGPHVVVDGFYYGIYAYQGGRVTADGATVRNAGDVGAFAAMGGVLLCRGCTVQTASHVHTDAHGAAEALGYGIKAEGAAFAYADGATVSDAQVGCIAATSNGAVWAHGAAASGCGAAGVRADEGGTVEADHAHLHGNRLGAYAVTGGRVSLTGAELDHNAADGALADGGSVFGTGVRSHDNGGSGVRVQKQGRGEFYGTLPLLLRNAGGAYRVEPQSGCTGPTSPCTPASTLILD